MKVNRNFSVAVQYLLDEWVPPRMRDSRLFMSPPMRFVLKDASPEFMDFKSWFFQASPEEITKLYERTAHVQELQGETDVNPQCIEKILKSITTDEVLEVGCGRAYLANLMSKKHKVTACDFVIPNSLIKKYPGVNFISGNIESLPFKDRQFKSVVSTHTLEHTQDLKKAISELRRVASKELLIVVPRQRPYKYTFSLHTQFFPYEWSITNAFGYRKHAYVEKLGDWFYYEKVST